MSIFLAINRETSACGVVVWTIEGYCRRTQENHRNGQEESDIAATSEPYTPLRKNRDWEIVSLISLTNFRWFTVFFIFIFVQSNFHRDRDQCANINLSDKAFTSITVTLANGKGIE